MKSFATNLWELIKLHPKKSIGIAVIVTGLICPQCKDTIAVIGKLLIDQSTPELTDTQQPEIKEESQN